MAKRRLYRPQLSSRNVCRSSKIRRGWVTNAFVLLAGKGSYSVPLRPRLNLPGGEGLLLLPSKHPFWTERR